MVAPSMPSTPSRSLIRGATGGSSMFPRALTMLVILGMASRQRCRAAPHFFPLAHNNGGEGHRPRPEPLGDFYGPKDNNALIFGAAGEWPNRAADDAPPSAEGARQRPPSRLHGPLASPDLSHRRLWSVNDCTDAGSSVCSGLSALYASTGGSDWESEYAYNWLSGDPTQNSWYGLTVDGSQVTKFKIEHAFASTDSSNHLPTQFGLLTDLTEFKLKTNSCGGSNCIGGTIPTQFGKVGCCRWFGASPPHTPTPRHRRRLPSALVRSLAHRVHGHLDWLLLHLPLASLPSREMYSLTIHCRHHHCHYLFSSRR